MVWCLISKSEERSICNRLVSVYIIKTLPFGRVRDRQNTHFGFKHRAGLPHICAHHFPSFIFCKIVRKTKDAKRSHAYTQHMLTTYLLCRTLNPTFRALKTIPSLPEGNLKCIVTTFTKQQALWGHSHEMKWSLLLYCEWAAQVTAKQKTPPCDDLSQVLGPSTVPSC